MDKGHTLVPRKNLMNVLNLLLFLALIILIPASSLALSDDQLRTFQSGAIYFDTNGNGGNGGDSSCTIPSSGGTTSSGSGSIYVIGDSLTVGMNTNDQLQTKLKAAGYSTVTIEAHTGYSVDDSLHFVQKDDKDKIASSNTVVVELGTNPGSNTSASSDSFVPKIQEMVSAIKDANPSANIYWMNAYADNDHNAYSGVNQAIQSQSSNLNFHVIDWHTEALTNNSKYAPFEGVPGPPLVHPASHYPELADFVVSALGSPSGSSGSGDQSGSCCGTTTSTGSDNEQTTWNFFKGKGLSDAQVAGIMGNIEQESTFVPTAMQVPPGKSHNPYDALGKGWGIIQWTGDNQATPGDRTTGDLVTQVYKESGVTGPVDSLPTQLEMVWQHMHNHPPITQGFDLTAFQAITDVNAATQYFLVHIEGGSDPPAPDGSGGIREYYARQILKKYGGTSGTSSSTGGCVINSSTDCTTVTGDPKILCEAQKYQGIYYRWGGGHQGYAAFIAGCPDPSNPPNNQPHGSPPDPTDGGASGNPSPCATDCSGLVSIAVDAAFNQNYNWSVVNGAMSGAGADGWKSIPIASAKAGDIVTTSEHVEIVVSVNGSSITTFGSHETGTKTGPVTTSTSYWSGSYHWAGPGSQ